MFHSCCGGGKVLLCRFPLFTSRHMKVVNTPADVMMQNYENCWKVGRQRYLHWWMNTWRCMAFFTVCVLMVCRSTWRRPRHSYSKFSLSGEPLKPNHTQVLSPLQHCNTRRSPLQQSSTWRSVLPPPPALSEFTPVPPLPPGAPRWRPSESWSTPRSSGQSPRPPPPVRWTSHCFSAEAAEQERNENHIILNVTEKRRTSTARNCHWDHCCANLILDKLQNGKTQGNSE